MKIRIFVVLVDDVSPRCTLFATEWAARHWVLHQIILPSLPLRERQSVERAFTVDAREIIREFLPRIGSLDIVRWEGNLPVFQILVGAAADLGAQLRRCATAAFTSLSLTVFKRKGS